MLSKGKTCQKVLPRGQNSRWTEGFHVAFCKIKSFVTPYVEISWVKNTGFEWNRLPRAVVKQQAARVDKAFGQCSQKQGLIFKGPVWIWKLDPLILVKSIQLRIFYDSIKYYCCLSRTFDFQTAFLYSFILGDRLHFPLPAPSSQTPLFKKRAERGKICQFR